VAFWSPVWDLVFAGVRQAGSRPSAGRRAVNALLLLPRRLGKRGWMILLALLAVAAVAAEMRTSWLQARIFAAIVRHATFHVEPGPNPALRFPDPAPYTDRLGYSLLPAFLERLQGAGYAVTAQARHSPMAQRLLEAGLYTFYKSKPQAGLRLTGREGSALFTSPYPSRSYYWYEEIPPVIISSLVFIENREILEARSPYLNPAVEWDRLAGALVDYSISRVNPSHRISGGSTLATQLEKLQYSPGGRTTSPGEKARQILRASLRAYRDGEITLEARRRVIRDYLNSLPLAASPGYGEVQGLGDGLWAWYGADFAEVNRLLSPAALKAGVTPEQARAYRQVLSLLLAVNSPGQYLVKDPAALETRTDEYLRLLARAGVIPRELAQEAARQRVQLLRQAPPLPPVSFTDRKGADAVRTNLLSLLGVENTYALDRLDLTVHTTLDVAAQQQAARLFQQFRDPEFAAQAGLFGERLLNREGLDAVIYSFTLYERTPQGNLLRVQTDSYNQPLNVSEGTKLELGSTAKLRTLAHYLEIVAELHDRYAAASPAELEQVRNEARDPIRRWAAEWLSVAADKSLAAMLNAALERTYSASPAEGFFTGGGLHYFRNFDNKDNGRVMSVSEAFQRSVNLVFIRLMRDIVRYHQFANPDRAAILEDPRHPARREYLKRFAEYEGAIFLNRFYQQYRGLNPSELQAELEAKRSKRRVHPLDAWLLNYLIQNPGASWSQVLEASQPARIEAYDWLFSSRRKEAQDKRIAILLEQDAFAEIHKAWKRLGFPFDRLVPSYATALGSSGDNPAALAELAGIILNDGVRLPSLRIRKLHFAEGTPWETVVEPGAPAAERVMRPEVAAALRQEMFKVVQSGTGRRAFGSVVAPDGTAIPVGGKTGTGDNRIEAVLPGGARITRGILNRTATFVFIIGDRFFGTVTAYVPGSGAASHEFTSALPVQAFRILAQNLQPLVAAPAPADDGLPGVPRLLARSATAPGPNY